MSPEAVPAVLPRDFEHIVQAHLDGRETERDRAVLDRFRTDWVRVLYRLLDRADRVIEETRRTVRGPERTAIIEDFDREAYRIDEVLTELLGPPSEDELQPDGGQRKGKPRPAAAAPTPVEPGTTELQLTWEPGSIIAWAAGKDAPSDSVAGVRARLEAVGGGSVPWEEHRPIKLPDGGKAETVRAPLAAALGWLVSMRRTPEEGADVGVSVPWLALTAVMAVRLAAQGRMVPRLRKVRRRDDAGAKDVSTFQVDWEPVLIDPDDITELAAARPTSAAATGNRQDGRAFTQSVLVGPAEHDLRDGCRAPRGAGAAAGPPLAQRRRRDGAGPPRRQALRRADPRRRRAGPPARPVGRPGHRDGQAGPHDPARPARRGRRLALRRAGPRHRRRARAGRGGHGERLEHEVARDEGPAGPGRAAVPRAAAAPAGAAVAR